MNSGASSSVSNTESASFVELADSINDASEVLKHTRKNVNLSEADKLKRVQIDLLRTIKDKVNRRYVKSMSYALSIQRFDRSKRLAAEEEHVVKSLESYEKKNEKVRLSFLKKISEINQLLKNCKTSGEKEKYLKLRNTVEKSITVINNGLEEYRAYVSKLGRVKPSSTEWPDSSSESDEDEENENGIEEDGFFDENGMMVEFEIADVSDGESSDSIDE